MYQDYENDYLMDMYDAIGTHLPLVAGKGLLDLVYLLIKNGAGPLINGPSGTIAFDRAIFGNHMEFVQFLRPLVDRSNLHRQKGFHDRAVPLTESYGTRIR
jgi:hypothetical protein